MVHRLGTTTWRTAFALFLLVVLGMSLVVFHAPTSEPSLDRFAVDMCDTPNEHDVPFLSRQAADDDQGPSSAKWTPRPPILTPLERQMFLIAVAQPTACSFDPPILRSTLLENPSARGPPVAAA